MKTKIVNVDNQQVILYKNENTGLWHADKTEAIDYFHQSVMESNDVKAKTIRKYYCESTVPYTRNKIREMINRDEGNLDQLYDTIVNFKLENKG